MPFSWKLSAYICHTTGSLVSHHFRSIGIPCSLYIDDRHIVQFPIRPEPKFNSSPVSLPKADFLLAQSARFIVCYFPFCVALLYWAVQVYPCTATKGSLFRVYF